MGQGSSQALNGLGNVAAVSACPGGAYAATYNRRSRGASPSASPRRSSWRGGSPSPSPSRARIRQRHSMPPGEMLRSPRWPKAQDHRLACSLCRPTSGSAAQLPAGPQGPPAAPPSPPPSPPPWLPEEAGLLANVLPPREEDPSPPPRVDDPSPPPRPDDPSPPPPSEPAGEHAPPLPLCTPRPSHGRAAGDLPEGASSSRAALVRPVPAQRSQPPAPLRHCRCAAALLQRHRGREERARCHSTPPPCIRGRSACDLWEAACRAAAAAPLHQPGSRSGRPPCGAPPAAAEAAVAAQAAAGAHGPRRRVHGQRPGRGSGDAPRRGRPESAASQPTVPAASSARRFSEGPHPAASPPSSVRSGRPAARPSPPPRPAAPGGQGAPSSRQPSASPGRPTPQRKLRSASFRRTARPSFAPSAAPPRPPQRQPQQRQGRPTETARPQRPGGPPEVAHEAAEAAEAAGTQALEPLPAASRSAAAPQHPLADTMRSAVSQDHPEEPAPAGRLQSVRWSCASALSESQEEVRSSRAAVPAGANSQRRSTSLVRALPRSSLESEQLPPELGARASVAQFVTTMLRRQQEQGLCTFPYYAGHRAAERLPPAPRAHREASGSLHPAAQRGRQSGTSDVVSFYPSDIGSALGSAAGDSSEDEATPLDQRATGMRRSCPAQLWPGGAVLI
eukprot:TRINITY_DN12013_c0_g1_i2.p1 TRINITY_DN12013_c0_g1~~TRINITY_DN12013_c0_g1_i2.p1  ORF type:complete len:700 (+),score=93.41 TRINITY_DN12013_c0_g1_i2:74-2101(+)